VRVSEQVMATYFFYKAFIKDGLLNFEALLFEFFDTHANKFSDTVVPANNVFGYSNVLKKINNSLNVYFELIKHNEKKAFIFFDKFWFYKQSAMIDYFYLIIEKLPESQNPIYDTHYETNDFVHDQNKTLSFLTRLLQHDNEYFRDALELCFEYCRKTPIALPELIRRIREKVSFRELDEWNGFTRQNILFNLLIDGFKEKQPYYVAAFFALAKTFLLHTHEHNEGGRNTIRFQRYPLPLNDEIKAFRQKIWEILFDSFDIYPNEVLLVIEKMLNKMMDPIPAIFKFDLDYLIPFFETKLTYNNFKHIHFVYHFISRLDFTFKKEEERTYHQLKNKFQSVEYEYFKQLDWGQLNNQKSYKFKNHELFAILKEEAIRKFFVFHAGGDFTTLHQGIENLTFVYNKENQWELHKSLNIIVEENCIQNLDLGFELLESILKKYPVGLQPLYKAIQQINKVSEEYVLRLWHLLDNWNHESKWNWQFAFFNNLSESFVNAFYIEKLLNTFQYCQVNYTLPRYFFDKLMLFDKEIVLKITNIIFTKNQTSNYQISLWNDFFETYSVLFPEQVDLFTINYIQQIKIHSYFDYNFTALKTLVQLKPSFLIEFIKVFFNKKDASNREDLANNLNFIWDLKDYEKQMAIISAFLFPEDLFWGSSEHRLNHFFKNLKQEQQLKATNFMLKLIEQHYNDVKKMNAIFNIIRISMPDLMEKALLHFLKFNTNIEIFKTIYWIGNGGGVYRGGAIVGRIKANKWHKILEIIEKSNQKLALIPIKTYIKQQIDSENTSGDWERKRQFINPER
jgi:hypothetical protein